MNFLTSRNDGYYKILISIFTSEFYKNIKNKKKVIHFKIIKKYDLNFLYKILKEFLFFRIKNEKNVAKLKYKKVNFGRYLLAVIYKDIKSYDSKLIFIYHFLKNIIIISRYFYTSKHFLKKNISSIYLDHCVYLNGIIFEIFSHEKKIIYLNNYPKDLIELTPTNKDLSIEDCFRIYKKKNKISINKLAKIKKLQRKISSGKINFYPWMEDTLYKKKKLKNLDKFDYIIYTHAFTDAQLNWGYDGFVNAYTWLDFTLNYLTKTNKNILVKAHPNFFKSQKKYRFFSKSEKYLFNKIIHKYNKFKNVKFLNLPIRNHDVMKKLKKKCIAITHHGSVGLELLVNNFKVISSECNFYDKSFNLSNQWSNEKEYQRLLSLDWQKLKHHSKNDLNQIFYELFLGETGYLTKNYHLKILNRYLIKKKKIINQKVIRVDKLTKKFQLLKNYQGIVKNLNFTIHKVKL